MTTLVVLLSGISSLTFWLVPCDTTNQNNSGLLSYKVVCKLPTEAFVHSTEMYKLNGQEEDNFWLVPCDITEQDFSSLSCGEALCKQDDRQCTAVFLTTTKTGQNWSVFQNFSFLSFFFPSDCLCLRSSSSKYTSIINYWLVFFYTLPPTKKNSIKLCVTVSIDLWEAEKTRRYHPGTSTKAVT